MEKTDVLLFSGGMDSLIAWEYLNRPKCIYVNLGHRYNDSERSAIKDLMQHYKKDLRVTFLHLLDVGGQFEELNANIPGRNLYLAMIALNSLVLDKSNVINIHLVVQKDEMNIPDRSVEFFKESSDLLSYLYKKEVLVSTPFYNMDKVEMVKWYKESVKDINVLLKTWACYEPKLRLNAGIVPCNNCSACFRRFVALKLNGINEDNFEVIKKSEIAELYKHRALNSFYSKERCEYILEALNI